MAHVGAFHQEVDVADDSLSAGVCGSVDDHVFANHIVVADDAERLLTTELEVLRQCCDDGTLVHLVAGSHPCSVEDAHEGEYNAVVADDHVVFNVDEWEYLAIVADLRLGAYFGFWTNFACHISII